jgi:GT2 family glycosyltransferase
MNTRANPAASPLTNMQKKSVSIVIVNYNTGAYAAECIDSLLAQQGTEQQIIVVDNASRDGDIEPLRRHSDRILLIRSGENLGFGRANNLGAEQATGEYLLLLNPDTFFEDPHAIAGLIGQLDRQSPGAPACGMLGPAIFEPRRNKLVKPRFHYPLQDQLRHTTLLDSLPGNIAWLLGACLLTRTALYRQIGGFDPDFFLYGEDIDICLRIRLAGYALGYVETIKVGHVAGASEIGAPSYEKWLRKKRGYYLFCRKHYAGVDIAAIARRMTRVMRMRLFVLNIAERLKLGKASSFAERRDRLSATLVAVRELVQPRAH